MSLLFLGAAGNRHNVVALINLQQEATTSPKHNKVTDQVVIIVDSRHKNIYMRSPRQNIYREKRKIIIQRNPNQLVIHPPSTFAIASSRHRALRISRDDIRRAASATPAALLSRVLRAARSARLIWAAPSLERNQRSANESMYGRCAAV